MGSIQKNVGKDKQGGGGKRRRSRQLGQGRRCRGCSKKLRSDLERSQGTCERCVSYKGKTSGGWRHR